MLLTGARESCEKLRRQDKKPGGAAIGQCRSRAEQRRSVQQKGRGADVDDSGKPRTESGKLQVEELCRLIRLPDEVREAVLGFDRSFDFGSVRGQLDGLLAESSRDASFRELRECLGEDPQGYKMLACQLFCMSELYQRYLDSGIGKDIFLETCGCYRRFVEEHLVSYGSYGFDRGWWTVRHTSFTIFRVGALEYEIEKGERVYIHIPSDAELTAESCRKSLGQAKTFMKRYFPGMEEKPWECFSWLLSPALKELLGASSNILRFRELFDLREWRKEDRGFFLFVFKRQDIPLEELPEETSLQRRMKRYLLEGGKVGAGIGVLKTEI